MFPRNARRLNEMATTMEEVSAAINAGQTRPTCSISHVAGSEGALVRADGPHNPFPPRHLPRSDGQSGRAFMTRSDARTQNNGSSEVVDGGLGCVSCNALTTTQADTAVHSRRHLLRSALGEFVGMWAIFLSACVALTLISDRASAATPPETLIAGMTEEVLAKAGQSQAPLDAAAMHTLVETVILPNVDFSGMTARAVGPRWRTADDAQKAQLMSGFEGLLIKTYAGAFSQAAGAKFRLKRTVTIDSTTQEIHSEVVLRGGGDPVVLNYRLSLQGDDWKVTDVSVMGVWIVPTYQTQFAQVLQNSGVDGLIQVLAEKARMR
jgi:phospholipid transport system substrate-binding protein